MSLRSGLSHRLYGVLVIIHYDYLLAKLRKSFLFAKKKREKTVICTFLRRKLRKDLHTFTSLATYCDIMC